MAPEEKKLKTKLVSILKNLDRSTDASIFFSGRSVRDILKRKPMDNIEAVVRGLRLQDVAKFIGDSFDGEVRVEKAYGRIQLKSDDKTLHIYLPRKGGKPNPFAHLKDDSKERVFTIDAMYLPLNFSNKLKNLIDHHGGAWHLRRKTIATVGKADTQIKSNPSVMLQAIALASELNYRIDTNLFYAMKAHAKLAENIPVEMVRDFLVNILLGDKPSRHIKLLRDTGLLSVIMPELHMCVGVEQNKKYHKYDVFDHCVIACDNTEPDLTMRLAALLHDIGKPITIKEVRKNGGPRITFYDHEVAGSKVAKKILRRLKFEDDVVSNVSDLVYNHMYNYEPDKWTEAAVRRLIKRLNITEENVDDIEHMPIFLLRQADRAASGLDLRKISPRQHDLEDRIRDLISSDSQMKVKDLDISGEDIMKLFRLQPGPTIGRILQHLLSFVMDNPNMNKRNILLEEASNYLSNALK